MALLLCSLSAAADFTLVPSTLSVSLLPDQTVTTSFVIHNNTAHTGSYSYTITGIAFTAASWQATGLWHRSAIADADGDGACWYYGREDTHTYNTGAANSGTLTSPPFKVLSYGAPLTFQIQLQKDAYYDEARVEVSADGFTTATTLMQFDSTVFGGWTSTYDFMLTQWSGKTVQARFVFDTHNALSNDFRGFLVDNVQISGVPIPSWIQPANITSGQIFPGSNSPPLQVQVSSLGLTPGTYNAVINVVGGADSTATYSLPVTLTVASANQSPVAVITTSADHGATPLAIHFDGRSSIDPDGSVVGYSWSFADGSSPATTAEVDHTFATPGSYTVTLTVTDNIGATSTTTRTITVTRPPIAHAVITPTTGSVPLTIMADGSTSVGVDGAISAYAWSFGDGSIASGASAIHTFANVGAYTVTLTVTDSAGGSASTQTVVTVLKPNLPPVATATAAPGTGDAPLSVAFDGSTSSDPDGSIVAYAWQFGDGGTATGATVSHVYTQAGAFVATLTVTDDRGATATATVPVTVGSRPSPPTNLRVTSRTRTMVKLAWTPPASGAASYAVYRDNVPLAQLTATSWIDADALGGHSYQVTALDATQRQSDPSDAVQTTAINAQISAIVSEGLTGDQKTLADNDVDVWYTNAAQVTVHVEYSLSSAAAEAVEVTLSDGSTVSVGATGPSGSCDVAVPLTLEGTFSMFVSVEAFEDGSTFRIDSTERHRLVVDRTPPHFTVIADPSLWDPGVSRQVLTTADAFPVTLNGNSEAGVNGNAEFRAHVRPLTFAAAAFSAWLLPHDASGLADGSLSAAVLPINGTEAPLIVTMGEVTAYLGAPTTTVGYQLQGFDTSAIADGATGPVIVHAVDRCGNAADVPLFSLVKRIQKVQPAFIPALEGDETSTTQLCTLWDVTFTAVAATQDVPGGERLSGVRNGWRLAAPIDIDYALDDTVHAGSTRMRIQDSFGNVSDAATANVLIHQAAIIAGTDPQGFIHYPAVNVLHSNASVGGFFGGYLNTGYMGLEHDFGVLRYAHGPGFYADEAVPVDGDRIAFDANGEVFPPLVSNAGQLAGVCTNVISLDDTLADGTPHCFPTCIANAASWEDQPRVVAVLVRSEAIGQFHDAFANIGPGMQPTLVSINGILPLPASAGDRADTLAADLVLDRTRRFTSSGWRAAAVGCDLPVGYTDQTQVPGAMASFFGEVSGRGFDVITLTTDIAGVGSHPTLVVEGGFLTDVNQFDPAGTTVELTDANGGVVSTMALAGGSDDPTRVTIHALRLFTLAPTSLTCQRLEIDCVIGAQVTPGIYGLRLRCGEVGSGGAPFEMPRCLAIVDGALLEYPLVTDAEQPLDAPFATATRGRYFHWRPISPALQLDPGSLSVNAGASTLHIAGRFRSSVRELEARRQQTASGLWRLQVDGTVVPEDSVSASGDFSVDVPLLQDHQSVAVTAFDAAGAWANATIVVQDAAAAIASSWDNAPAFHRIDLGPAIGDAATAIQAAKQIVVAVVDQDGVTQDQLTTSLVVADGHVLTEPFLLSAPGRLASDALAQPENPELVVPTLYDDIVLLADGRELVRIPCTGLVIDKADTQRVLLQQAPVMPDDSSPTPLDVNYTIRGRNVSAASLTVNAGYSFSARSDRLNAIALGSDPQRRAGLTADVPTQLAMGVNVLRLAGTDPDGRPVAPPHDPEVYVLNRDVPAVADAASIAPDHAVLYAEFNAKYEHNVAALNGLAHRYDLRVVGHEVYSDGRGSLLRVWFKLDGNYDPTEVLDALHQLGAVAHAYRDDLHVVDTLRHLPPYEAPPSWQSKGMHVQVVGAWEQQVRAAVRDMHDNQAACLNAALSPPDVDSTLFIADARATDARTTFATVGLGVILSVRREFDDVHNSPPHYSVADADSGAPSYVLRQRIVVGADQARSATTPFPAHEAGMEPRVCIADPGTTPTVADLISDQTQGVVVVIHGFNVDPDPTADVDLRDPQQTGARFYEGCLRCYWPQFQMMLRDPSLGGLPWNRDTKAGYPIIHVGWVGNFKPVAGVLAGAYFNYDEALAHDAGERVLVPLIRDIDARRSALGLAPDGFTITVIAESLGNRVATSMFNALRSVYDARPNAAVQKFPRMRYVMVHPAMRHTDIGNAWIGKGVKAQSRVVGDLGQLPQSAMQNELAGVTTWRSAQDPFKDGLLFFSPFDKAGLIFESAQNPKGNPDTQLGFHLRKAFMLGRVGLDESTWMGGIPTGYDQSTALVRLTAVHSQAGTLDEDLWHVSLFGWILPGMQSRSRPTYEWNQTTSLATRALGLLETDENIQITTMSQLQPIWQQIGAYIQAAR